MKQFFQNIKAKITTDLSKSIPKIEAKKNEIKQIVAEKELNRKT